MSLPNDDFNLYSQQLPDNSKPLMSPSFQNSPGPLSIQLPEASTSLPDDSLLSPATSRSPQRSRASRSSARRPVNARQQFTACGACRMRRVRCDLKDIPRNQEGAAPWAAPVRCSNCSMRNWNCVDEYETKPTKMLRRGRRLLQVEQIYGSSAQSPEPESSPAGISGIPALEPSFFDTAFFRQFCIQRPLLDGARFKAEYLARANNADDTSGDALDLIASLLVVWAASFGIDPTGIVHPTSREDLESRRLYCNGMVQDILKEIDVRGMTRRPSWDHVRVLLLVVPLTQDVLTATERKSMYDSAMSHVYTLCSLDHNLRTPISREPGERLLWMRVWWYAFVHEGISSGLRGDRLVLDEEVFADLLPTTVQVQTRPYTSESRHSTASSPDRSRMRSSTSVTLPGAPELQRSQYFHYTCPAIKVSLACRLIHETLTGARAQRRRKMDEATVQRALDLFEEASAAFDELLRQAETMPVEGGSSSRSRLHSYDIGRDATVQYANAWQILLVKCHDVVREALFARLVKAQGASPNAASTSARPTTGDDRRPAEAPPAELEKLGRLHALAESKCLHAARKAITLLPSLLDTSFFEYDCNLVSDGISFAGYMLATQPGTDDEVQTCLDALGHVRWAYARVAERVSAIQGVWQQARDRETQQFASVQNHMHAVAPYFSVPPSAQPLQLAIEGAPYFLQSEIPMPPPAQNFAPVPPRVLGKRKRANTTAGVTNVPPNIQIPVSTHRGTVYSPMQASFPQHLPPPYPQAYVHPQASTSSHAQGSDIALAHEMWGPAPERGGPESPPQESPIFAFTADTRLPTPPKPNMADLRPQSSHQAAAAAAASASSMYSVEFSGYAQASEAYASYAAGPSEPVDTRPQYFQNYTSAAHHLSGLFAQPGDSTRLTLAHPDPSDPTLDLEESYSQQ